MMCSSGNRKCRKPQRHCWNASKQKLMDCWDEANWPNRHSLQSTRSWFRCQVGYRAAEYSHNNTWIASALCSGSPPRLASSSKNHLSRLQAISGQISYIIWTTLISHIYLFLVLSGDKFQMLHPCSTLFGLDFAFPLDLINSSAFNVLLSTDIDW